jgi:hypothetical protein
MTISDADRLVRLLPTAHRMRDADLGGPLTELLRVIAEQVEVVDEDIAQLYENWFIETCQPWVVPYIGDLVGYLPAAPLTASSSTSAEERDRELRAAVPRRDVAHTIGDRRRKGTLALLEDIARDAAGWPARAVEFYRLLAVAQSIDHLRLRRGRTVDLRAGDALDRVDGAFDELAHTVSVGRLSSARRRTRYDIPSVGLYVWRLRPYSVTHTTAVCIDRARSHYLFNVLAIDTPLVTKPVAEPSRTHVADETNVPAWIRRRAFDERTADYYGPSKSIVIWRDSPERPVPLANVVAADLSGWTYRPQGDQVAVDPVLGRIAFDPDDPPDDDVWVTYHYGFSADMGGGEYPRPLSPRVGRPVYRVGAKADFKTIVEAVRSWQEERAEDAAKRSAIIEIQDSGVYEEPLEIDLAEGDRLELRAAQGRRPVIRVVDRHSGRADALRVRGIERRRPRRRGYGEEEHGGEPEPADPPQIVFDGLLVMGRDVWITGRVGCVVIRHCTFVPGWSLELHCEPRSEEPSLLLERTGARVIVEHSILGGVRIFEDERHGDPISVSLSDSILDATKPSAAALCGRDGGRAHVVLTVVRSTVIGELHVHSLELAENSILDGLVRVARRRPGCVRFCYVPDGSRTPARYECQPDLVEAAVRDAFRRGELDEDERDRALRREAHRVRPQFESVRYGTPQYCRLSAACAPEITRGADDESELGAFHDLFQPQRQTNLEARLAEFSPAGSDAAIVFVT